MHLEARQSGEDSESKEQEAADSVRGKRSQKWKGGGPGGSAGLFFPVHVWAEVAALAA